MKLKLMTAIAFCAMAIMSCNEETLEVGSTLTSENDKMDISTGVFTATSKSILADSVYARNFDCYFGNVRDPETGAYIKSEFMAQFNMLESPKLPAKDRIVGSKDGAIAADSCEIWLFFDRSKCYGDSLTPVKIDMLELKEPMSDQTNYYSNFDPKGAGYVRNDGLKQNMAFTLSNLTYSDSIRGLSGYRDLARIVMSGSYTDKNGKQYPDYGTYILQNYYEHPEYFKNSYNFIHSLCPGFYFEVNDGLGVMANLSEIDMRVFYSYKNDKDSVLNAYIGMSSTPEVLQTTRIINDKEALQSLVNKNDYTYLKTPAGIFTEVTFPVDEITATHAKDSLLSVSVTFQRLNSGIENTPYVFEAPEYLLMIPKDSLYTFFEKGQTINSTSSFYTILDAENQYEFSNIGNMITYLSSNKAKGLAADPDWVAKHPNWNKIVLVPVTLTTATSTTTSAAGIASVANQMSLTSTRLQGGPNGEKIELQVIYAKFHDN